MDDLLWMTSQFCCFLFASSVLFFCFDLVFCLCFLLVCFIVFVTAFVLVLFRLLVCFV